MAKKPKLPTADSGTISSEEVIRSVLSRTDEEVAAKKAEKDAEAREKGRESKFNEPLAYAVAFAKHMSEAVADALRPAFPEIVAGEIPSQSVRGLKRVDVRYSTPEAGLGLALSFKSVHRGEEASGNKKFTHNMKRNDEELRVEATGHHLRQPYAVMVAVIFLPLEACTDRAKKSSFGSWVEYLWPLKGRTEPEDPPDRYELVFIALYARDGRELGFYEVGGAVPCPATGRPRELLTLRQFLERVTEEYRRRNGLDFSFDETV